MVAMENGASMAGNDRVHKVIGHDSTCTALRHLALIKARSAQFKGCNASKMEFTSQSPALSVMRRRDCSQLGSWALAPSWAAQEQMP